MPTKKEELALNWVNKSEEEKQISRNKTAYRVKKHRAGLKKREEMETEELSKVRAKEKNMKRIQRKNMTEEQRETVRAKDRARKARDKNKLSEKKNKKHKKAMEKKKEENDSNKWEKKKMKQLMDNCKTQQKIEALKTDEEIEEKQVEKVIRMREKRSQMSIAGKKLARIYARKGMRDHRRFGFLKEYKQRKRRDSFNPYSWEMEPDAISDYFKKVKEAETDQERKERLKRMNQIRVERHRKKIQKMLQEPVIIEDNGQKGEYELLRERNIKEFERLKKESGLFE